MEQKVFDKIWFASHQKSLLWLANSWLGKHIFRFKKMGHFLDSKKKIVKITPCSVAQFNRFIGKEAEFTEHFFSRNEYARKLYFYLYPLWLTMHIWDWFVADHFQLAPQLSFGFSTLTVYPDASSGGTTVDGVVLRIANESFSTLRSGAGTNAFPTATKPAVGLYSSSTSNVYANIVRNIFTFDTSSIGSGANISAVTFSGYGNYKSNDLGSDTYHFCSSTPAANNNLQNSDYGQLGSTSFGSISYASFSTSGYNDWSLNASGISNVTKAGISKFGLRGGWDIDNSTTGLTWAKEVSSQISINHSDFNSNNPKLVVTYTTTIGIQLNITDTWKQAKTVQVNIGDTWKAVTKMQINIGDVWKSIF